MDNGEQKSCRQNSAEASEAAESAPRPEDVIGRSPLAQNVTRLKQAVFRQAAKRERLPLELFWSLFHSEIDEIKRQKEKNRELRKLFYGIDI